ncbi:MAG TPA: MOSC domain-containing protein [Arenimonas sp.]|nr:MOSC domain-containing protein [Arenimonas sp.]
MQLSALHIHPVKSCAALSPESIRVESRGAVDDRRWMLVDPEGRFITGRQLPLLVRLQAEPVDGGLQLRLGDASHFVPAPAATAARHEVVIWKDRVSAALADAASSVWLSEQFSRPVQLVHMDEAAHRPVSLTHGQPGDEVSFADGYPLLLLSQGAVDALSQRVGRPMDARRFRPNLIVSGTAPHAEDNWRRVRIGGIRFDVVKPCVRCVFTTVDPERGEREPDGEPLATLKTYRRMGDGVTFGMNLIPRDTGVVSVGDAVEVLEST